ncbi:TPA: hypothetical protein RQK38_000524 [Vibrio vulnificus]|nr:hypothetical protein [Vibrio vulnificus]
MTAKNYEQGVIYSLVDYNTYWKDGEHNPARNADTYHIMDLKSPTERNHGVAVKYFGEKFHAGTHRLLDFLQTDTVQLAIVPSSKNGKVAEGLEGVIGHVKDANLLYNRNFLVRTKDIPAAHEGGERSTQKHLDTIEVQVQPNPDIPLILLDDVTTTGTSLDACKQILDAAGVKQVYMVALGRTV